MQVPHYLDPWYVVPGGYLHGRDCNRQPCRHAQYVAIYAGRRLKLMLYPSLLFSTRQSKHLPAHGQQCGSVSFLSLVPRKAYYQQELRMYIYTKYIFSQLCWNRYSSTTSMPRQGTRSKIALQTITLLWVAYAASDSATRAQVRPQRRHFGTSQFGNEAVTAVNKSRLLP